MKTTAALAMALPLCAAAGIAPHVDQAALGGRRLVVTLGDSLQAPDLSFLRLEGYGVEHAVFLEESDDFLISEDLWDLTVPGGPRMVRKGSEDSGLVLLETAPGRLPAAGILLADTAQGGFLAKVVEVREVSGSGAMPRFWVRTQPAHLNEAILQGTLKFSMRLDMNSLLSEYDGKVDVTDAENRQGEMEVRLKSGKVLFQPTITGSLGVKNGLLETMRIRVQGTLEVSGAFSGALRNPGRFTHVEALPTFREFGIPLGHGLVLTVRESFDLRVEANAEKDEISGSARLRLRQNPSADMIFNQNRWESLGEARDVSGEQPELSLQGAGWMRFGVDPRIEFLVCGQPGPGLVFSPSIRLAGSGESPEKIDSGLTRSGFAMHGMTASAGVGAWLGNGLLFRAPPLSTSSGTFRAYPLFNREVSWLSPPREGLVRILEGDSASVLLECQTNPKSDYFVVQTLSPSGNWETVLFGAPGPGVRVGDLTPGTRYQFRVLGVNAHGTGRAFPPEGISYSTPLFSAGSLRESDSSRYAGDSTVIRGDTLMIFWRPVAGMSNANGVYNVYFGSNPESLSPVAQSLRDSQAVVIPPDSGTYFWKVEYVEGQDVSGGLVHRIEFDVPRKKPAPAPLAREWNGMPLIPAGSFTRADGKTISIAPFYLQRFEVTQLEYRRVKGNNPSFHTGDSLPVERVSWEEAASYCRETGARLPSEAEWEYAARAGESGRYFWGRSPASEYARFRENSENRTWSVGSLKPNGFGLYDMAGNVFEWVQDWYGPYGSIFQNPRGAPQGTSRVIRGASWYSEAKSLNLSSRFFNRPGFRNYKVGFRCAQDVRPPETVSAAPQVP